MIKEGNISEECGELIKPWWSGEEICAEGCCGSEVMAAITNHSRGLLCSPLLWIIRARRCSVMRAAHQRGSRQAQLPTVIQEGDLGWAVGPRSEFNTKWAVLFLDNEEARILINTKIDFTKKINPQSIWSIDVSALKTLCYIMEVIFVLKFLVVWILTFYLLLLASLVWFPYFEDPRIFSQPNDGHYRTA